MDRSLLSRIGALLIVPTREGVHCHLAPPVIPSPLSVDVNEEAQECDSEPWKQNGLRHSVHALLTFSEVVNSSLDIVRVYKRSVWYPWLLHCHSFNPTYRQHQCHCPAPYCDSDHFQNTQPLRKLAPRYGCFDRAHTDTIDPRHEKLSYASISDLNTIPYLSKL